MRRKWTDDDVDSLCEMWGNSSVERICIECWNQLIEESDLVESEKINIKSNKA